MDINKYISGYVDLDKPTNTQESAVLDAPVAVQEVPIENVDKPKTQPKRKKTQKKPIKKIKKKTKKNYDFMNIMASIW